MRKNVFIGLLLIANFLFSQSIDYDKVISELRQKEKQECVKNPINCSAFSSQIQATIIELENRRDAEKNNYSNQLQKQEASNTINKLNQPQINYQNPQANSFNYFQNMTNDLNSASVGFMQGIRNMQQYQMVQDIQKWNQMKSDFSYFNNDRLDKVVSIYNSIEKKQFKPLKNGFYKAYYFSKNKFSFSEDKDISTVTDVLIKIENNKILQILPEGKADLAFNVNPTSIKSGVTNFIDIENLKTSTIVIIDPYLNEDYVCPNPKEKETAKVYFWTSNKQDEGKKIFVQERGEDNKILRETQTILLYSKNEKEILDNQNFAIVNINRPIVYYGTPTSTPYGILPRMLKIDNKKGNEPLKEGEIRYVRIKKYGF